MCGNEIEMKGGRRQVWPRIKSTVREVAPSTWKTCIWIIKLTVGVSFAMMLLKYFNVLPWISDFLSPVFGLFGLPGATALAYVSGYFVNCYTAIAVMGTLDLDPRSLTILCTMLLCSHSMVLETAVLKKTGASGIRMVIVRTLSAMILGFVLNKLLPVSQTTVSDGEAALVTTPFMVMLLDWLKSTVKLCLMMIVIIFSLNIVQRLLTEFGIMKIFATVLKPLMLVLGLPAGTAFLWLVANVVGLGYGAAAMLDEIGRGNLSKRDVLLVDSHICINHSNVEDLMLFSALGAVWWVMLLSRTVMAALLVWELRLEMSIRGIVSKK